MTNNIKNNDLYIILSSIKSGDNGYTLDDLKNYALATNSADAFINLLELDELGKYYGVAVQDAVDKIISENPNSARGLHLSATVEAIKRTKEHFTVKSARGAKRGVRSINIYNDSINKKKDEISKFEEEYKTTSLGLRCDLNADIVVRDRYVEWVGTTCGELYEKAMLAYLKESKKQKSADAVISRAKACILNNALFIDKEMGFNCDELNKACEKNPNNAELKYFATICELASERERYKWLSYEDVCNLTYQETAGKPFFEQANITLGELAQNSLSEEGEKAIELGVDYCSNADEMAE